MIIEAIREAGRSFTTNVIEALLEVLRAGRRLATKSLQFVNHVFRYQFDQAGNITMGMRLFTSIDDAPPNVLSQFILFIPVVIPSWILAALVAPAFYHSTFTLRAWFITVGNLSLFDLSAEDRLGEVTIAQPWYRIFYGMPGLVLGFSLGLSFAICAAVFRIIGNSIATIDRTSFDIAIFALDRTDINDALIPPRRSNFQAYVLGFPGLFIGIPAGLVGFATLFLVRHSSIIAWYLAINITHLARLDLAADQRPSPAMPRTIRWLKGFPGLFIGIPAGVIGFASMVVARTLYHSTLSAWHAFADLSNLALEENEPHFPNETRVSFLQKYILGFPGLLLGIPAGLLSYASITVVRNTALTAWQTFINISNLAAIDLNETERVLSSTTRLRLLQWITGSPGLIIGIPAGIVGFTAQAIARSVYHSTLTAWYTFTAITKLALEEDAPQLDADMRTSKLQKYGFGFPGLLLGFPAGLLSYVGITIARNADKVAWQSFVHITNIAALDLDVNDRFLSPGTNRLSPSQWITGSPGFIIGIPAGIIGVTAQMIARTFYHSTLTAWHTFADLSNAALERGDLPFPNDSRVSAVQKYGFGFPGLIMGGPLGLISYASISLTRNAALAAWQGFVNITNVSALDLEVNDRFLSPGTIKLSLLQWFKGSPGLLIGIPAGIIGFTTQGLTRGLYHASLSAWHTFAEFTNTILEQGTPHFEPDRRTSAFQKYGLGSAGLLVGVPAGLISISAILLKRHSGPIAEYLAINITHLARLDLDQDQRLSPPVPGALQWLKGFPGIFIGVPAGIFGFSTQMIARSLYHSPLTAWHAFADISNLALEQDEPHFEQDARTSKFQKYGLGFPGLLLGAPAGLIGYSTIVLVRNSSVIAHYLAINITNLARFDLEEDQRPSPNMPSALQWLKGVPGLFIGVPAGIIGFTTLLVARTMYHSTLSAWHSFADICNLALEADEPHFAKDARNNKFQEFVLGFPGLYIGVPAGMLSYATITLVRNTAMTAWHVFVNISNLAALDLNDNERVLSTGAKKLSPFQWVTGSAGIAIGIPAGIIGFSTQLIVRTLFHSALSAWHTFTDITNLALEQDEPHFDKDLRNRAIEKYGFGFPGIFVGIPFGVGAAVSIGVAKGIMHSALSWFYLSSSMVNLSLEHKLFPGLLGDNRSDTKKYYGSLGYLAGFLSTGVVCLAYVVTRYAFLSLCLGAGILGSVIVAPSKWIQMYKHPRFVENASTATLALESDESIKIQKFKNIYSSLDAWGALPEDSDILTQQSGKKGAGCFVRKAITFNVTSKTERIFDALLSAYTQSDNKPAFFDADNVVVVAELNKIKEYYKRFDSWQESTEEILNRDKQIDDIAEFVLTYMRGQNQHVPVSLYKNHQYSMQDLFFGYTVDAGRTTTVDARVGSDVVPLSLS